MDKDKITYSTHEYNFDGTPKRCFFIFNTHIHEDIGVKALDEKIMLFVSSKKNVQVTINLQFNPNNLTSDKFINELNRLRKLPNEGNKLYAK